MKEIHFIRCEKSQQKEHIKDYQEMMQFKKNVPLNSYDRRKERCWNLTAQKKSMTSVIEDNERW